MNIIRVSNPIKQVFSIGKVTSTDKSIFSSIINITGSQEVKIKSVRFQTGYAHSSGGYGFSVKLEPNPPNGKSCQVVFGDMGPNKALTKNAPASCEDLQLTTTSQIGVSKSSNQLTSWGTSIKDVSFFCHFLRYIPTYPCPI